MMSVFVFQVSIRYTTLKQSRSCRGSAGGGVGGRCTSDIRLTELFYQPTANRDIREIKTDKAALTHLEQFSGR